MNDASEKQIIHKIEIHQFAWSYVIVWQNKNLVTFTPTDIYDKWSVGRIHLF